MTGVDTAEDTNQQTPGEPATSPTEHPAIQIGDQGIPDELKPHGSLESDKLESSVRQTPPPHPASHQPRATPKRGGIKIASFILNCLGFVVLCIYTLYTRAQWLQIRYTNTLTARALDGSDKTLQRTLDKMQGQIDATNRLYTEAQKLTAQALVMATNSGVQSSASKRASRAAESAANTAVETLHVTERAYIAIDEPTIDVQQKVVTLPIFNVGHIASGEVQVVVHQAITNVTNPPSVSLPNAIVIWQKHHFDSAIPGKHLSILVPFATMRPEILNNGHQAIYVAGTVAANDGFPDTPPQTGTFCFMTKFIPILGHVELSPCDAASLLPLMEAIDGYPNNEMKQ